MICPRSPSLIRGAAGTAAVLFGAVALLQLLLAAGLLPITMAWGGTQETLTPGLRAASLLAVGVLALFAYIILRRAGLVGAAPVPTWSKILSPLVAGFMVLNTLGNLASQSRIEKLVFTPMTILLALACGIVSFAKPREGAHPKQ